MRLSHIKRALIDDWIHLQPVRVLTLVLFVGKYCKYTTIRKSSILFPNQFRAEVLCVDVSKSRGDCGLE